LPSSSAIFTSRFFLVVDALDLRLVTNIVVT